MRYVYVKEYKYIFKALPLNLNIFAICCYIFAAALLATDIYQRGHFGTNFRFRLILFGFFCKCFCVSVALCLCMGTLLRILLIIYAHVSI